MLDRANDTPNQSPTNPQADIFKPRLNSGGKSVDPNQLLYAEDLLRYYQFALEGRSVSQVLQQWAIDYPVEWIRLAIIEALYQGRYKAVSVDQILRIWQRRSQAQPRFDDDFAQLIRQRLPNSLGGQTGETTSAVSALAADIQSSHHRRLPATANQLDDLTEFVQSRRSRSSAVDAVINHAEANVDRAANQAKQQLTQTAPDANPSDANPSGDNPSADNPPDDLPPSKAIHQFTPKPPDSDWLARLRSVSNPASNPLSNPVSNPLSNSASNQPNSTAS
jgi:hypothetical protein